MNYVIGGGGGGSLLLPPLVKYAGKANVTVIDGDKFEEKNLDRQLFAAKDIGRNKAVALGELYGIAAIPEFFHSGLLSLRRTDVLFCCADNHACRKEALQSCDTYGCRCVIGANEFTDAEAYWYDPVWKDTPNDPRVFYPAILTDTSGDPLGPPGCVEQARVAPQLVFANFWGAALMTHLFYFHTNIRPEWDEETEPHWPVHERASASRLFTIKRGEKN